MTRSNIAAYFRERFPMNGVALISISVALLTLGLQKDPFTQLWLEKTALIAVVFATFLLRQRIVDEFKDEHHDTMNFPDRPLQRGIISPRELVTMGIFAFIIELLAVFWVGAVESLVWYMPILIYSLLMAKEFFVSKWLEAHFTVYFLVHEVVFVLLGLWLCWVAGAAASLAAFAWIVAFTSLMMSIELGRKLTPRHDRKGKVVNDTYATVWGRANTLSILESLMMIAGIALSYSESSLLFALISAVAALILNVFTLHDKMVKTVIIMHLLLLIVLGIAI